MGILLESLKKDNFVITENDPELLQVLDKLPNRKPTRHATQEQIEKAEIRLGTKFSSEYKLFLSYFGSLRYDNGEIKGLNSSGKLNVIYMTLKYRGKYKHFPKDLIVISTYNNIILHDTNGLVYKVIKGKVVLLNNSLLQYLKSL